MLFSCFALSILSANAQDVKLFRTADDNNTVGSFTYPSKDVITYLDTAGVSFAPKTSANNICGAAAQRVSILNFSLNVKSTSIGKIVLIGQSSGTSTSRSIFEIKASNTVLVKGKDYQTSTTVKGNTTCGEIVIEGLNIPKNEKGTEISFKISGTVANKAPLGNLHLSEIVLTPVKKAP